MNCSVPSIGSTIQHRETLSRCLVVLTFLAEDGVVGKTLAQDVTNRLIRGEVRVGYRRPVALGIGRRRFSVIELPDDSARRERRRNGGIEIIAGGADFAIQSVVPSSIASRMKMVALGFRAVSARLGLPARSTRLTSIPSPVVG